MKKLPYIPNKDMYAAVMGACSMIRETGKFWTAVNYYADKHNVDKEEMIEYIRIAQSNGQRKAHGKPSQNLVKPFRYWACISIVDKSGEKSMLKSGVRGARNYSRLLASLLNTDTNDEYRHCRNDEQINSFAVGNLNGYETRQEALEYLKTHQREIREKYCTQN